MWVLGIDVSKEKLDVYLLEADGSGTHTQVKNKLTGYKKLQKLLRGKAAAEGRVVLEATGVYGESVAEHLNERGYWVSVVNPARVKRYAQSQLSRTKTDQVDAALIADFGRTQELTRWEPPSEAQRELQALLRHLDDLQNNRQSELNRLESQHRSEAVRQQLVEHIAFLDKQIAEVKEQIEDHLDQYPDLKKKRDLLTSIPGIGGLTASILLAECGDLTRFGNVRQLVAFVGLNPQQHQSGNRSYTVGISRIGSSRLRAALYMPAVVALRWNPICSAFAEHLRQNGLVGKQIVVAVMRKLLHLAYGILKHGQPFDPHYLTKQVALA